MTTAVERARRAAYMRRYRSGIRVGRGRNGHHSWDLGRPVTGCCEVCGQPYARHPVLGRCFWRGER